MGGVLPRAISASHEIGAQSCLNSSDFEDVCLQQGLCDSSDEEKAFIVKPPVDLGICSASQDVGAMVQELGMTLSHILHTTGACEPFDGNLSANDDVVIQQEEIQTCMSATVLTDMIKDANNLYSEVVQSPPLAFDTEVELPSSVPSTDSLLESENSADDYSAPLPASPKASPKPLSAMKGTRAKQGLSMAKLSVKWSSDVYDPPVTADSHTMKVSRQRPKSRKDQPKSKYTKSKSSRSSGDKKHVHRKSTSSSVDSRISRSRAYSDRLQLNNIVKSKLDLDLSKLDLDLHSQELGVEVW